MASVVVATTAWSCAGRTGGGHGTLSGATLDVAAVWSGSEQERFTAVLQEFERRTGVHVTYTSTGHSVLDFLTDRMSHGDAPDVAFLPQPGLLRRFVAEHRLTPLDASVVTEVRRNYPSVWRELGSVDGKLYGVWFKAANKSLVWYNVGAFEKAGMVPARTVDELLADAESFAAQGLPAFSVAGADGWTLTDWFENLYLRFAGPDRYDALAQHSIAWTDPSVVSVLRRLDAVLAPRFVAGGTPGALTTGFEQSVVRTFSQQPAAAMVFEGDFVAATITGQTNDALGVDADVFPFPSGPSLTPAVVGGGDAAVLLRSSPAGNALLQFLASPDAAAIWARRGGFVSPNINLDLSVYPDDISRSVARGVVDAGEEFHFDLSDVQPGSFGASPSSGMRKLLQDFLRERDADATAAALEVEAKRAFSVAP